MKVYAIRKYDHEENEYMRFYTSKAYALKVLRKLFGFIQAYEVKNKHAKSEYVELYNHINLSYLATWRNKKTRSCFDLRGATWCVVTIEVKEVEK